MVNNVQYLLGWAFEAVEWKSFVEGLIRMGQFVIQGS
jgi:hypothetical protein